MGDAEELERLEEEERSVSARRRRLHDRIDFARASASADGEGAALDALLEEEREVSRRRKALHVQIDELRARLGRQPGPTPRKRLLD